MHLELLAVGCWDRTRGGWGKEAYPVPHWTVPELQESVSQVLPAYGILLVSLSIRIGARAGRTRQHPVTGRQ